MRFLPAVLLALALPGAALAEEPGRPAVVSHALTVTLDPAKGGIEATDRMTVRRNGGGDLVLDLRADLALRLLEVDGKAQGSVAREPADPRPGMARYRVRLLPVRGDATVVLSWGGILSEAVKKAQDLAFVVGDASNGHISEKGVYLGEGTGWCPLDGSMATFTVTATVPEGWSVATQGGVPSQESEDGRTVVSFPAGIPCDGLWLQAGKWKVERRTTGGGISIATYLSEGNAGLSGLLLDSVEEYLGLFGKVLGPYPHAKFDIVENFFTTGYGMPTATLLGGDVVQHMGMMAQRSGGRIPPGYIDHELVHCWWGNGVFVDYDSGNWCEALTTYCSNYLRKEWESAEEAAKHRRGVRSRFAARVQPAKDYALRRFTGKTEDFENDIGYGKGSMVFHAVRRAVGDDAFFGALRDVVAAFTGKRASWDSLRLAFEKRSGRNLSALFDQYLDRTGAPVLVLRDCAAAPAGDGWTVSGKVVQQGDPWTLSVPMVVETAGEPVAFTLDISQPEVSFSVRTARIPTRVLLDPDSHCWRGYAEGEVPATLDATLHDPAGARLLPAPDHHGDAYRALAEMVKEKGLGDSPPDEDGGAHSLLVLANLGAYGAMNHVLASVGPPLRVQGTTVVAGGRRFEGEDVALLASTRKANDPRHFVTVYGGISEEALSAARRIFFYGGDGVVVFKAGRPVLRLEAEGDESSRAPLLDGMFPEPSPDRADAQVKSLSALGGRLAGSGEGRKALDLLEKTLRDEDGLAVVRQPFTFEVADWDGSPCTENDPKAIPLAFSPSVPDWVESPRMVMKLRLPEKPESLLAAVRNVQEEGADGLWFFGPEAPPPAVADYLLFPSTLPKESIGRSGSVEMAVVGKRSRLLRPDFEVKIPVLFFPAVETFDPFPGRFRSPITRTAVATANLLVLIPGTDPALAGEAVLLGAHHDHIGPGFPGADDDASGVAAVRESARVLAAHRGLLRRPVVLALFGAEEWGLQGSRHFAAHRPEGIPPVVAALTLDTVGAKDVGEVNVVGESVYPALAAVMARCLEGAGLRRGPDIDRHAFVHGSDHYALHEAGIPAIDLFSGNYGRMHTKDDTVDTVDPAKIARLARAAAAWALDLSRNGVPR